MTAPASERMQRTTPTQRPQSSASAPMEKNNPLDPPTNGADMNTEPFCQWAIVELFGHQRMAGRVTNEAVGGCNFVRVDVPETKGRPAFTRLLGQGAIYAINIVSEDVARAAAASFKSEPVSVFDLPQLRQQSLPIYGGDGPDDDDVF